MRIREAKDFLVAQTAEQAALEGVPLSDLEKRMMYFTEGKDAVEDPTYLNEEFEAQYDTAEYEKKVSRLMSRAYKRLRNQNAETARRWDAAIRILRRGDHYILILWGHPLKNGSPREWFAIVIYFLFALSPWIAATLLFPRRNGSWPLQNYIPVPNPHLMQFLFLALIIVALLFPKVILKPADWFFGFIDRTAGEKNEQPES
jgi:hypothetical protein